ncbi:hypothetical protein [Mesobacillus zeae]|uniref:hypothetical protein n=1 Tax=Mesobacillus zeae TaxID=1917180 RepID=UPI0021755545|nr:hypothetical protein [Mesobacillus zeae]
MRYIRLHDLRHTSATLLISQGVHAKIISERLGYADIRITMDTHGHALQTADEEAAKKIRLYFFSSKKQRMKNFVNNSSKTGHYPVYPRKYKKPRPLGALGFQR